MAPSSCLEASQLEASQSDHPHPYLWPIGMKHGYWPGLIVATLVVSQGGGVRAVAAEPVNIPPLLPVSQAIASDSVDGNQLSAETSPSPPLNWSQAAPGHGVDLLTSVANPALGFDAPIRKAEISAIEISIAELSILDPPGQVPVMGLVTHDDGMGDPLDPLYLESIQALATTTDAFGDGPIPSAPFPSRPRPPAMPTVLGTTMEATLADNAVDNVEIDPVLIEQSPTLQRWLEGTPNVLEDIRNDPSFRTRLRVGYVDFPSSGSVDGFQLAIEDVFIGHSGVTLNGDYGQSSNGDRESYGIDARYYVLPLGGYFNVAPVLGYRYLETAGYSTSGLNLGIRLQAVLSRTGAADVSLTQSWVSLFGEDEVGITSLGAGYALTQNLRISTEIQWQNSRQQKDSRVGIFLEWMLF